MAWQKKKRKPGRPKSKKPTKKPKHRPGNPDVKRNGKGQWLPGTPPPNPWGRPKGSVDMLARMRRMISGKGITPKSKQLADEVLERLFSIAVSGAKDGDSCRAIEGILDRLHGKPKQTTEVLVERRDAAESMTDEQLVAFLDRERARRESGDAKAEEEDEGEEEGEES